MTRFFLSVAIVLGLFSSAFAAPRVTKSKKAPAVRPATKRLLAMKRYSKSLARATLALKGKNKKAPAIVQLSPHLKTIVIPDVHARTSFLSNVLKQKDKATGKTYGQLLKAKKIQVVVVGDGMHAESRAASRWAEAEANPDGKAMRAEIGESLGTMKQIMDFKAAYPKHFHYLKGNHDNITDRNRGGDFGVVKYTEIGEGRLVKNFLTKNFGKDFIKRYDQFERSLPIVAVGKDLAISHSGPLKAMKPADIGKRDGKAVENFTWTDLTRNSGQQARVVDKQLKLLGQESGTYLAGHRETGNKAYRRQGRFVQVNADNRMHFVVVDPAKKFNAKTDVRNADRVPRSR